MGARVGAEPGTAAGRPPAAARDASFLRALAARVEPGDATAHNNVGVLLATRGLVDDALDAFLRGLERDGRFRVAAENVALLAAGSDVVRRRVASLEDRLDAAPDDVAARATLAHLLRLLGRAEEARPHLDVLLTRQPDDAERLVERGLVELAAGAPARAQRWFERAVQLAPRHAGARVRLAEALYHQGRSDAALGELLEAFARGEDSAEAHLLHSFVLGELGLADDACLAAAKASRRNPSVRRGEPALRLSPGFAAAGARAPESRSPAVRLAVALALRERGYLREALEECERAVAEDHADEAAAAAEQMADELLLVLGRAPEALARYERRLLARPADPRLLAESGVALHHEGALDAAEGRYRQALAGDPTDAVTWYNLGVVLAERGEREEALRTLARAEACAAAWSWPVAARERLALLDPPHRLPLALACHREWPDGRLPERRATRGEARRESEEAPPVPAAVADDARPVAGAADLLGRLRRCLAADDLEGAEALLAELAPAERDTAAWRLLRAHVRARGDERQQAEARREVRALVDADAFDEAAAWHLAGDVAATVGDAATAVVAWRAALARDPERPTARVGIARVLLAQGQQVAAMVEASAAVARAPRARGVAVDGSRVLQATGAAPAAVRTLARYLLDAPDDVEALCALGAALLATGAVDEARMVCERARGVGPASHGAQALAEAIARVEARSEAAHLAAGSAVPVPAGGHR